MKKLYYLVIYGLFTTISFYLAPPALAASSLDNLGKAAEQPFQSGGYGIASTTPGQLVGGVIKVALGFVGTVAFVIFLYGGFLWLTARGSEEQVSKAKKFLTNGAIGTVVIILAYSATYYVTDVLYSATR